MAARYAIRVGGTLRKFSSEKEALEAARRGPIFAVIGDVVLPWNIQPYSTKHVDYLRNRRENLVRAYRAGLLRER